MQNAVTNSLCSSRVHLILFAFEIFLGDGRSSAPKLEFSQFWGSLGCSGEEVVPATYFSTSSWLLCEGRGLDVPARRPMQHVFWLVVFILNLACVFRIQPTSIFTVTPSWDTIRCKIFRTNPRNPVKLDRTRKVWYLLLRVFWLLLPKFNFWKEDWALDYVSTIVWDFPNISLFPKILSLKSLGNWQLVRQLVYQVCYTRYHVQFYLWLIRSVLKRCKVPKYYEQDWLDRLPRKVEDPYPIMRRLVIPCQMPTWKFQDHGGVVFFIIVVIVIIIIIIIIIIIVIIIIIIIIISCLMITFPNFRSQLMSTKVTIGWYLIFFGSYRCKKKKTHIDLNTFIQVCWYKSSV